MLLRCCIVTHYIIVVVGHQPCSPLDLRKIHGFRPFGIISKSKMINCITEFLGAVLILVRDFVFPSVVPFPLTAAAEIEFVI